MLFSWGDLGIQFFAQERNHFVQGTFLMVNQHLGCPVDSADVIFKPESDLGKVMGLYNT